MEEIKTIREASGCEAHYRETEDLEAQASVLADQIRETKPTSLAAAIAMLEWDNEIEDSCGINAVIAGLRGLSSPASRGGADPIVAMKSELDRLQAEIKRIPDAVIDHGDSQALVDQTCDLEAKILEAVAIAPAGLIAQIELFRDCGSDFGPDDFDLLIAGVRNIAGAAGAPDEPPPGWRGGCPRAC